MSSLSFSTSFGASSLPPTLMVYTVPCHILPFLSSARITPPLCLQPSPSFLDPLSCTIFLFHLLLHLLITPLHYPIFPCHTFYFLFPASFATLLHTPQHPAREQGGGREYGLEPLHFPLNTLKKNPFQNIYIRF